MGGSVEVKSLIPSIEQLCRRADGAVFVSDYLSYATDDTWSDA
ncbi:hypothetical protein AB0I10_18605 [Streptomyces sp. NPDC050636]